MIFLYKLAELLPVAEFLGLDRVELEKLLNDILNYGVKFIGKVVVFFLIIFVGFWIVKKIEKKALNPKNTKFVNPTVQSFFISFFEIVLKVLVFVVAIVAIGVDNGMIVAAIGSAGIAVGLAMQGSLSNLAAGLLILTSKLFDVDDYIEFGDYGGTVISIGLFYTKLKSPDGKAVFVPNSSITTTTVVNFSVFENRRVDIDFGVDYDTDIDKLQRVLYQIAEEHPLIMNEMKPMVTVVGYGDYAVDIKFRVYTKGANYWDLYFEIYTIIFLKFREEGISFPFPRYVVENYKEEKND